MTLPNFVIIGAAKSGTSSLYRALAAHPQVFMSPLKETNYFAWEGDARERPRVEDSHAGATPTGRDAAPFPVRTPEAYAALFAGAGDALAIGEASPRYLISPGAAERIARELPDAKIVACLRQPVERALSGYFMQVRKARLPLDPGRSFREDDPFVAESRYADNLARYFDNFERSRIHILLFDDLRDDADATMRALCRFLSIDEGAFSGPVARHNPGWVPRNAALNRLVQSPALQAIARRALRPGSPPARLLKRALRSNREPLPDISLEEKRAMMRFFEDDISRTEVLIGRDLSAWRQRFESAETR